jgi:hypothetical protein
MNDIAADNLPQLAPPGAGLPWLELKIARIIFKVARLRSTREKATQVVVMEGKRIEDLATSCTAEQAVQRVLIKRLPGMEDSSRYWSVCMTLDHLRIVNLAVADTIKTLGKGEIPAGVASTAAVKPDPMADGSTLKGFLTSCKLVERAAAQITDLRTSACYEHPWFGALDAGGWHFLAGFHMQLHRRQIEMIIGRSS